MTHARTALPLLTVLALSACATVAAPPAEPKGYLGKVAAEGIAAHLAPPPEAGSPVDQADKEAVRAAQAPPSSPRVLLAQADAELDPESAMALFDCALGTQLQASKPPALTRLFTRELADASDAWTAAKTRFAFRPKPNVALSLTPCTEPPPRRVPEVSAYPAAHAVTAELWSRTLAEIAPDRAEEVAQRARVIDRSRMVCALQYPTDLAAGRALGGELFEAMRPDPDFKADLEAARAEVAAARASGRVNPGCLAERQALSF